MTRLWIAISIVGLCAGCHGDAPAPIVVASADAAPAATPRDDTVEALWQAFREAHFGSKNDNVAVAGKKIYALLSRDARTVLDEAASTAIANVPENMRPPADVMAYRILGAGVAKGRPILEQAGAPLITYVTQDQAIVAVTSDVGRLSVSLVREHGRWWLALTPDLVPGEDALFPAVPRPAQARAAGGTSVDDVARLWANAVNDGDGWQAYNLFDSASKKRLNLLVQQMGGNGEEDVVRIVDKTVRDRQTRGLRASVTTVRPAVGDHAGFDLTYNDGRSESFEAVHENGAWWISPPM